MEVEVLVAQKLRMAVQVLAGMFQLHLYAHQPQRSMLGLIKH
jgi:hypothetical protein